MIVGGKVLDSSAVRDLAAGDSLYGRTLLVVSNELGTTLAVPLVALSAAWQTATVGERPWLDLLLGEDAEPSVVIVPVDTAGARGAGLLAADAGQPHAPLGSVHATYVGRQRGWPVVTKYPDSVLTLASDVITESLP